MSGDSGQTTNGTCIRDYAAAKIEIVQGADVAGSPNESHSIVRERIISRHFGEAADITNRLGKRSLAPKVLKRY
ncbi:hypothetical protein [Bosea rubneri]|uniref:Uncharacterized protein n=1 Tax=Bosea rubneri TaxID=3075434 RepID=A0ABU3SFS4_9HYPH|nr:hypothetical protein [Bosea sp. ZW T0_25]MDU0343230.1 hypothetical protein [Bosea sp. ZW T0_25]